MSGGGGHLILHGAIASVASLETVTDSISVAAEGKLNAILQKPTSEWTQEEFHFCLRCIARAYDELCGD